MKSKINEICWMIVYAITILFADDINDYGWILLIAFIIAYFGHNENQEGSLHKNLLIVLVILISIHVYNRFYPNVYLEPRISELTNKIIVNDSYEDVWDNMINKMPNEYSIEHTDKKSGLIVLLVEDANVSKYATGGVIKKDKEQYDYAEFITENKDSKISVKINILISKSEDNKSLVRMSAVYNVTRDDWLGSKTWVFNSSTCGSAYIPFTYYGTPHQRKFCSNHKLEKSVLSIPIYNK